MLAVSLNPFPTLETERLVLRQVMEKDVPQLFQLRSDWRIMKYIDKPLMQSEDDAMAMLQRIQQLERKDEGINWAITLKGEDVLLGTVGLFSFNKEHHRCEIGYMLYPDYQRRGIVQEALDATIAHAFRVFRFHSIEANVNPENEISIKLLEKYGFVREAYFKENFYHNGQFLDSAIYSLLCHKWL